MANTNNVESEYGKLDIVIAESSYEAGRTSSVSILIRNPFNKPVELIDIQGPKSSNLQELKQNKTMANSDSIGASKEEYSYFKNLAIKIRKIFSGVYFTEVSFGGVNIQIPRNKNTLNISTQKNAKVIFKEQIEGYDKINIEASEDSIITIDPKVQEKVQEEQSLTISPHCEIVAYFNVTTTAWLFYSPSRKIMYSQITYKIGSETKTQVVSSAFEIKPPLASMVIGSIMGGTLGSLARTLNTNSFLDWQPLIVSLGSAVVMSTIATIALSRKAGSQGFITVEDFYGGFVVGALIGYGGSEYFEQTIINSDQMENSVNE